MTMTTTPVCLRKLRVWFTGDLIRPDDTDTDVYGEPTEAGHGQRLLSGWLDPDWSMRTVYANRPCVRPDTWQPDDGDPVAWLVGRLEARLNGLGHQERGTFYSADAITVDLAEGSTLTVAAHAEGFTDDELARAALLAAR